MELVILGNTFAPNLPPIRLWGGLFSITTWAVAGRVDSGRPWREDWKFDCLDLLVVVWGLCYLWWKRIVTEEGNPQKPITQVFCFFHWLNDCFGQSIHVSDDLLHHARKNHIQISKSVASWFPIDGNSIQETLVFHAWLIAYCTRFLFFLGIRKAIIIWRIFPIFVLQTNTDSLSHHLLLKTPRCEFFGRLVTSSCKRKYHINFTQNSGSFHPTPQIAGKF